MYRSKPYTYISYTCIGLSPTHTFLQSCRRFCEIKRAKYDITSWPTSSHRILTHDYMMEPLADAVVMKQHQTVPLHYTPRNGLLRLTFIIIYNFRFITHLETGCCEVRMTWSQLLCTICLGVLAVFFVYFLLVLFCFCFFFARVHNQQVLRGDT